jgi:hypothetical protein
MVQLASPVIQATTGAIPVAGAPIHAAIGGLLVILQTIDVRASLIPMMPFDQGSHREIYKIRKTWLA